jgi:ubiquinone/menaquinone biosynthesis C-methylase UbiE
MYQPGGLPMLDLKGGLCAFVLYGTWVMAGAHTFISGLHPSLHTSSTVTQSAATSQTSLSYETRAKHDPDGTGRFYMGREIAQVMGPGGMEWLDRGQRDTEEHPTQVLDALELHHGEVVVDLGAGSGYFTFRMAPEVGDTGKILAVDVQDEMLQALKQRAARMRVTNVEVVRGTDTDPHLPADTVNLVLMVDVYHELAYPREVMERVRESLKPKGRVVFVEYRKEDPAVQIKEVHKMSVTQLKKEMNAAGLVYVRTVETLPLQHIVIFEKK